MDPCIFCGTTVGRPTVEHVIPQWVRRCLDVHGPVALNSGPESGAGDPRRVDNMQHLNITLRGVICSDCNNGYLSRLETAARPTLAPMIVSAQPTTLDLAAQAVVATWAVKTVLLFELAARQKYPRARPVEGYAATAQEFAWLRSRGEPPPRSLVWLGCWNCEQTTLAAYEPSGAPLPTADGHTVAGHLTTFSLGFLALQVFTVDFVAADHHGAARWNQSVPASLETSLARIWPAAAHEINWPTNPIAREDWSRLVTWDDVLRPSGGSPRT